MGMLIPTVTGTFGNMDPIRPHRCAVNSCCLQRARWCPVATYHPWLAKPEFAGVVVVLVITGFGDAGARAAGAVPAGAVAAQTPVLTMPRASCAAGAADAGAAAGAADTPAAGALSCRCRLLVPELKLSVCSLRVPAASSLVSRWLVAAYPMLISERFALAN